MKNPMILTLKISLLIAIAVPIYANQNPQRPDITGGAALIFNRPENPKNRPRDDGANRQRTSSDDKRDQVEDAISLGNAARDRTPPDFESAEKAYRLASKLDPRDPRPYLGLGNLFWDQRRFPEAAKAYREALRHSGFKGALYTGILNSGKGVARVVPKETSQAQVHLYLAAALLEEQNGIAAEKELRATRFVNSDNPEWHALLGYSLSIQSRYTDAAESYKKAMELEPLNSKYKQLFETASRNSTQASANDLAIKTQLQNTSWEIKDGSNSKTKGICKLVAKASVKCNSIDANLPFSAAKWGVQDGLVEIKRENDRFALCIGQIRGDTMEVRCYTSDATDLWTRLRK